MRAGSTTIRVSSGDVELSEVGGPLVVESSSGSITGAGLDSAAVAATASSGEVTLDFATAPDEVDVDVSSGDVELTLPTGGGPYRLDVATSSGDQEIEVPTDAASARTVAVEASSGDVAVRGR